ncbi:hypothetical protein V8E54_003196 [Elaphomyces granulatus]
MLEEGEDAMEPQQEQDFYRRLHSSTRTLLYGPVQAPRVTISTTSNLQRPPLPPRTPLQMSPPMSPTTVTMTATATARTVAATVAATAAATAATTQPRKRGRPKGSKDKELRKRRQKATGGGDTMATDN